MDSFLLAGNLQRQNLLTSTSSQDMLYYFSNTYNNYCQKKVEKHQIRNYSSGTLLGQVKITIIFPVVTVSLVYTIQVT